MPVQEHDSSKDSGAISFLDQSAAKQLLLDDHAANIRALRWCFVVNRVLLVAISMVGAMWKEGNSNKIFVIGVTIITCWIFEVLFIRSKLKAVAEVVVQADYDAHSDWARHYIKARYISFFGPASPVGLYWWLFEPTLWLALMAGMLFYK